MARINIQDTKEMANKPTYDQLMALVGFAFKGKINTYDEASKAINYLTTRPTEKQVTFLKKYGTYNKGMTRKEASKQISAITKSWDRADEDTYYFDDYDYLRYDIPNM